jgi:ABC-type sugar transport system ATPase subunit
MTAIDNRRAVGAPALLEARAISKSFPGVKALDAVDFGIRAGEVHAICGENGAGKSTLMKILAGGLAPDGGTILFRGEPVRLQSPLDAKRRGILLIHQEISLVNELTVAENIYLGSLPAGPLGRVRRRTLFRKAAAVLEQSGIAADEVHATDIVGTLSIARQQMVEIARASALRAEVVIFDEPTASLTIGEAEVLFRTIHRLRHEGVGVVYISHKMNEVFALSDRITVLRDGTFRGVLATAETSESEVTRLMIGRTLAASYHKPEGPPGAVLLAVRGLSVPNRVSNVDLTVRQGEIVGLYGLIGAGRSELAEAICGLRERSSGTIMWEGTPADIRSSRQALDLGIALVPEDRKSQGVVLGMSVENNLNMVTMRRSAHFGFNDRVAERATYDNYRQLLRIKVTTPRAPVGVLSGGNQQKVVLGKWLATNPKLLILDEPTRGIDVGAKAEIHELISKLAEGGLAVLLISSEMPEILGLSHRILTMHEGRIMGEFESARATEDELIASVMRRGGARMRHLIA